MKAKKGLGKGLDALLGASKAAPVKTEATPTPAKDVASAKKVVEPASSPATALKTNNTTNAKASSAVKTVATEQLGETSTAERVIQLEVERCQRGKYQPRRVIDNEGLEDLAASIKQQGIMQPIVVRPIEQGETEFEIIAGERRWRAAQLAGLSKVPTIIREVADEDAVALALIENLQRENLNPMDEAYALYRLQQEFELTHQEVADAVGKSRSAVSNALRLMGLCKEAKTLLENGDIEMGHARALLPLSDQQQIRACSQVIEKRLNVRQTEALAKNYLSGKAEPKPVVEPDANILALEGDLSDKLGAAVSIQHTPKGKGKLVINYNNLDELDGILEHIQ